MSATSATTNSSSSPQRIHYQTPGWKVTPTVDTIASACGLPSEVTGLIMSAIIGGLNRRQRRTTTNLLGSIPAGPNLLIVGADRNPGFGRLLSMLLQPLNEKQGILRESVAACRRERMDLLQFGPEGSGGRDDSTSDILERIKEGAFRSGSPGLGAGWKKGREITAARHPSVYLSNPEPDVVLAGLEEAIEGQLLVADETGDLFHMLAAPSCSDRIKANKLKALLGPQGSDGIISFACHLLDREGGGLNRSLGKYFTW